MDLQLRCPQCNAAISESEAEFAIKRSPQSTMACSDLRIATQAATRGNPTVARRVT
jgi:hypothetical protein